MNFEDELKKRMALAQIQGWKPQDIQRSALIERALQQRQQQTAPPQQEQPKKAGRSGGLKGLALDLIPFGRIGEKIVNPNAGKIGAGEFALETGLTLLPFAGKFLGFGAKAGVKAGEELLEGGAKAALKEGAEAGSKSIPQRIGEIFKAPVAESGRFSDRLIKQGTIAPTSTLASNREQQALLDLVKENPAFRGSAQRKFRNVGGEINSMSNQVDDLFAGVTTKTTDKQFTKSINSVRKEIVDPLERKRFDIEFDRAVRTAFDGKLPSELSPTDVNQLRRAANKQMSGIYKKIEKGTQLTDKDTAFLRLKDTMDEQIAKLAPDEIRGQVQTLNRNMNTLMRGEPEFKKAAESGLPVIGKAGGAGPALNQVIQSGADLTGRGVRQASRVARAPAGRQALVRAGADLIGVRPALQGVQPGQQYDPNNPTGQQQQQGPQGPFAQPGSMDEASLNELSNMGANTFEDFAHGLASFDTMPQGGQPGAAPGGQQAGGSMSSAELFDAAMKALMAGDVKSANTLEGFAKTAMDFEETQSKIAKNSGAGGGNGLNVTKVTAQQYGLAQSGNQALQQLAGVLQNDPSVLNRSATPGRSLPGVGGFISRAAGTGDFDAIGYNIADTILRLRTGAQANESEVRKLQSQIMPRAGDSTQTVNTKMNQISSIFGNVLQLAQQPSSGGLEDELSQMFAGQTNQYAY